MIAHDAKAMAYIKKYLTSLPVTALPASIKPIEGRNTGVFSLYIEKVAAVDGIRSDLAKYIKSQEECPGATSEVGLVDKSTSGGWSSIALNLDSRVHAHVLRLVADLKTTRMVIEAQTAGKLAAGGGDGASKPKSTVSTGI